MTFTTTFFLLAFLPLTLAGYYLIRKELQNTFLLLASLIFYAMGDVWSLFYLVFSIGVNYLLTCAMGRNLTCMEELKGYTMAGKFKGRARGWMVLTLLFNGVYLFAFKYLPVFAAGLPLGISFYTFRTLSYCLDVYWQRVPYLKNPIDLALYVSFFPQVSMGPVCRFTEFAPQLKGRTFNADLFREGVVQITAGLLKKLVLANGIGTFVDRIFAMEGRTVVLAWVGVLGYLLQLYYDFSGYSDMALGLGKLFGFTGPKNFDYPYISRSVGEFWNRWHMTLGGWLRDYLYTPLFRALMNLRVMPLLVCDILSLFVTWVFAGVWHGAGWKFLLYGLYYFAFIAWERILDDRIKKRRRKQGKKKKKKSLPEVALSHIYCLMAVIFGQLLFRIPTLGAYLPYVGSMFVGNVMDEASLFILRECAPLMAVGTFLCLPVVPLIKRKLLEKGGIFSGIEAAGEWIFVIFGLLTAVAYMVANTYQPFIYFNF